jgi:hypothetical protein
MQGKMQAKYKKNVHEKVLEMDFLSATPAKHSNKGNTHCLFPLNNK